MTTPTTGDRALSYVPKIIAAYDKAINSTKGSLITPLKQANT